MQYGILSVEQLRQAFHGAKAVLGANKAYVDSLNVFPVPDGDTGTNMHLTLSAAVREMDSRDTDNVTALLQALSSGALMGARGNSGVILSQLFRGFYQGAEKGEFDSRSLANAFRKAAEVAYRSVIKPVEGTMLTVARACAEGAQQKAGEGGDCLAVLETALSHAEEALKNTPRLLPVLAEAGVVDAGGQGLVFIIRGMIAGLKGEVGPGEDAGVAGQVPAATATTSPINLTYRYCTELIIKGQGLNGEGLKKELLELGDSLLVVGDEHMLKVHIHTNRPGLVLEKAVELGTLFDIKIDNMEEQHRESKFFEEPAPPRPLKEMAVVAVTVGEGLTTILQSLGVDVVIPGGQTMNPSTEDLLAGIREAGARQVIVLPNNKNIFLAAEQAKTLAEQEGIQAAVIPARNFPQSVAAMLSYHQEESLEDNRQRMTEALDTVRTGEITFAVRDSQYNGFNINRGEILGLADGEIVAKGEKIDEVALHLLEQLGAGEYELLSVYFGQDVTEEDAAVLQETIQDRFPQLEIEMHNGGQPLYYYIFGLE
ncbi:MAG TPA: DAK2 domain-containing protein [Clostridia bacterium]|nr:DAK2 domain-containing protein [Clostridia bacterium]